MSPSLVIFRRKVQHRLCRPTGDVYGTGRSDLRTQSEHRRRHLRKAVVGTATHEVPGDSRTHHGALRASSPLGQRLVTELDTSPQKTRGSVSAGKLAASLGAPLFACGTTYTRAAEGSGILQGGLHLCEPRSSYSPTLGATPTLDNILFS